MDHKSSPPNDTPGPQDIEKKLTDLAMLMQVSAIISSTLNLDELMPIVMEKAKEVMDADACSILLYNRETDRLEFEVALSQDKNASETLKKQVSLALGQGIAGWVAETLQPILIADAQHDARFFKGADAMTGFVTRSLIAVPLVGRNRLIGVAEIMNPRSHEQFTDYDLELFQALCRQVAVAIENALYHRESLAQERIKHELELATIIQQSFLPPVPEWRRGALVVRGYNLAAKEVGGDLYDFIDLANGMAGIFIGDISGKGISAALFMAKSISDFRHLAAGTDSPGVLMQRFSAVLANAPRGMFLAGAYVIADPATGQCVVASAGNPPFFLVSSDSVRLIEAAAGPPAGILETDYGDTTIDLQKGQRLIIFTDGVIDAKNRSGERFGIDRVRALLEQQKDSPSLVASVSAAVENFSRGTDRADDVTLVEIGYGL